MGHQEMETTTIYLSKIRNTSESTKALVNATFAGMDAALRTPEQENATPVPADDDEVAESAFMASFAGKRIPPNPGLDTKAGQTGCKG
jgi:hypothetical protein